jgi:DNA-binding response OmpR family regulator
MRVLVIDDEKMLADMLVTMLQLEGYEAAAAYNGETALRLVDSFQPGCVICDVVMPGMNGVEVCTAIHAKHPDARIVLFSGQAETNGLLDEARRRGCAWEFLAKPAQPDELLAKLSALEASDEMAPGSSD